jgi:hypothetical protein
VRPILSQTWFAKSRDMNHAQLLPRSIESHKVNRITCPWPDYLIIEGESTYDAEPKLDVPNSFRLSANLSVSSVLLQQLSHQRTALVKEFRNRSKSNSLRNCAHPALATTAANREQPGSLLSFGSQGVPQQHQRPGTTFTSAIANRQRCLANHASPTDWASTAMEVSKS